MEAHTLLGLVAGGFTTTAFLPQVVKTWRSKSAGDLSLGMFAIFSAGVALWLVYGIVIGAPPVIVANGVTLVLALTILFFADRTEARAARRNGSPTRFARSSCPITRRDRGFKLRYK
ncbi:MAG TPA: SemiSWEET transporter [Acidiferrobacterales bacterium]